MDFFGRDSNLVLKVLMSRETLSNGSGLDFGLLDLTVAYVWELTLFDKEVTS